MNGALAITLAAFASLDAGRDALGVGESRSYELTTKKGTAYVVTVEEIGIDCDVVLVDGDKKTYGFDGDTLRYGRHRIAFVAAGSTARLGVTASRPGSPPGAVVWHLAVAPADAQKLDLLETDVADRYRDPARAATDETVRRARAVRNGRQQFGDDAGFVRASLLLDRVLAGVALRAEAIRVLEDALPAIERLGERRLAAGVYNNIAMHRFRMGDGRLAEAPLRNALIAARAVDDVLLEAVVQNNWCLTTASRGQAEDSVRCYRLAMELSVPTGDTLRIATAHNNLGHALSGANRHDEAAQEFDRAIELRTAIGDVGGTGDPLGNLGLERQAQQRYDEAEALFVRAEVAYRAAANRDGLATALRHRGQLRLLLGDAEGAAVLLGESVALDRENGRRRDLITALTRLGEAQALSTPGAIPAPLVEALALAEIDAEPRILADALVRLARAANKVARTEDAIRAASRARDVAAAVGDIWIEGLALLELARAALAVGDAAQALERAERSAAALGSAAHPLGAGEARGVAGMALIALGRFDAGIDALAAATTELERARSSLAAPDSRARFFAARRSVHEAHVLALLDAATARRDARFIEAALVVSDAHRSRALLDRLAPDRALTPAGLATWPADVALLHFLVTPKKSVALVRVRQTVHSVTLPGRAEIEAAVTGFRAALRRGEPSDANCATLWDPLAELDLPERVAIVADGPLLGLPWAALPCAGASHRALVAVHEIFTLPSLGAWHAGGTVAPSTNKRTTVDTLVVVDPVYRADDARLVTADPRSAPIERFALRGAELARLPGSLRESRLIERLHDADGLEVLAGFAATREAVLARLPNVRSTLHFGTHGVAGTSALGESGLVLSLFDRDGRRRDGFLSATTIAASRNGASLVVLAACDSASGLIVNGEAALGVSYAFSMAGARQVVGAMWPVADGPTSMLMQAFYAAYLEERLTPAAALRRAQLALRASPRYRDPRHWAAFQLSGGPE